MLFLRISLAIGVPLYYHISLKIGAMVKLFIVVMKHQDQKKLGKKNIYIACTFISKFIIKGSQIKNSNWAGTWRQELMQRTWKSTLYWLASHDFLIEPRTTIPEVHHSL